MVWENGTDFFLPPVLEIFEIQSPMFMANREGGKAGGLCFSLNPIPAWPTSRHLPCGKRGSATSHQS